MMDLAPRIEGRIYCSQRGELCPEEEFSPFSILTLETFLQVRVLHSPPSVWGWSFSGFLCISAQAALRARLGVLERSCRTGECVLSGKSLVMQMLLGAQSLGSLGH